MLQKTTFYFLFLFSYFLLSQENEIEIETNTLTCQKNHPLVKELPLLVAKKNDYLFVGEDYKHVPPLVLNDYKSTTTIPVLKKEGKAKRCANTSTYKIGAGKADITGPWAGRTQSGWERPTVGMDGLHQRAFARTFIIGQNCSNKLVILTNIDKSFTFKSVRDGVARKMAEDPQLKKIDLNSWLISGTHTHNQSNGHSKSRTHTMSSFGFRSDAYIDMVNGVFTSIKEAYTRYQKSSDTNTIELGLEELLNASTNRNLSSYFMNPQEEIKQYLDSKGNPVTTNKLFTQLNFKKANGDLIGLANWFAVHSTSGMSADDLDMGKDEDKDQGEASGVAHGDSKGYAAATYEDLMRKKNPDFIAGFFQSDEGDVIPIRYSLDGFFRGSTKEEFPPVFNQVFGEEFTSAEANIAFTGSQQLKTAIQLVESPNKGILKGPIDYRLEYLNFENIRITDTYVLNSLKHKASLDVKDKKTCSPGVGLSMAREFIASNTTCVKDEDFRIIGERLEGSVPAIIPNLLVKAKCKLNTKKKPSQKQLAKGKMDFSCQAEKPILFKQGANGSFKTVKKIPIQIIRIGNLAFIGLPFEVTTMAGRRIRKSVHDILKSDGVEHVVIAGLANEYLQYLTTREEYSAQGYEGASTAYGPWALAAVQQETRTIATKMIQNKETIAYTLDENGLKLNGGIKILSLVNPIKNRDIKLPNVAFGEITKELKPNYKQGETLRLTYLGGNPENEPYMGSSYFVIQQKTAKGWKNIANDTSLHTHFMWNSNVKRLDVFSGPTKSELTIRWRIPLTAPNGLYRIKYKTKIKNGDKEMEEIKKTSKTFNIRGNKQECNYRT